MSYDPKWHADFLGFVGTGKAPKAFLDELSHNVELQKACDVVFERQLNALRDELQLHPTARLPLPAGKALMDALFDDIAHGDANHRAWLKGKLAAWAPRVADATEAAAVRRAAENVLDCEEKHKDRLECCYATAAMLRDVLGGDTGRPLEAELAALRQALATYGLRRHVGMHGGCDVYNEGQEDSACTCGVAEHNAAVDALLAGKEPTFLRCPSCAFETCETGTQSGLLTKLAQAEVAVHRAHREIAVLTAKAAKMRAALKAHEPYRSVCSCGLVCSAATLTGHLRDCPGHADASPLRVADEP